MKHIERVVPYCRKNTCGISEIIVSHPTAFTPTRHIHGPKSSCSRHLGSRHVVIGGYEQLVRLVGVCFEHTMESVQQRQSTPALMRAFRQPQPPIETVTLDHCIAYRGFSHGMPKHNALTGPTTELVRRPLELRAAAADTKDHVL